MSSAGRRPVFVLVHSAAVGPATWMPVAGVLRGQGREVVVPSMHGFAATGPPYVRAYFDSVMAELAALGSDRLVVLAGHSSAGLFLPAIAAALGPRDVSLQFVDASVPELRGGDSHIAPPAFTEYLESIAVDGVLPRWSGWWPGDEVTALFPDAAMREAVTAEEPRLPIAFFEETVPVPSGWADRQCGYLVFSEGYEQEAVEARALGWPVRRVSGGHLQMLHDPAGVAGAMVELSESRQP